MGWDAIEFEKNIDQQNQKFEDAKTPYEEEYKNTKQVFLSKYEWNQEDMSLYLEKAMTTEIDFVVNGEKHVLSRAEKVEFFSGALDGVYTDLVDVSPDNHDQYFLDPNFFAEKIQERAQEKYMISNENKIEKKREEMQKMFGTHREYFAKSMNSYDEKEYFDFDKNVEWVSFLTNSNFINELKSNENFKSFAFGDFDLNKYGFNKMQMEYLQYRFLLQERVEYLQFQWLENDPEMIKILKKLAKFDQEVLWLGEEFLVVAIAADGSLKLIKFVRKKVFSKELLASKSNVGVPTLKDEKALTEVLMDPKYGNQDVIEYVEKSPSLLDEADMSRDWNAVLEDSAYQSMIQIDMQQWLEENIIDSEEKNKYQKYFAGIDPLSFDVDGKLDVLWNPELNELQVYLQEKYFVDLKKRVQTVADKVVKEKAFGALVVQLGQYFEVNNDSKFVLDVQEDIAVEGNVLEVGGSFDVRSVKFFYDMTTGKLEMLDYLSRGKYDEADTAVNQSFVRGMDHGERRTLFVDLPTLDELQALALSSLDIKSVDIADSASDQILEQNIGNQIGSLSSHFKSSPVAEKRIQKALEQNILEQEMCEWFGDISLLDLGNGALDQQQHPDVFRLLKLFEESFGIWDADKICRCKSVLKDVSELAKKTWVQNYPIGEARVQENKSEIFAKTFGRKKSNVSLAASGTWKQQYEHRVYSFFETSTYRFKKTDTMESLLNLNTMETVVGCLKNPVWDTRKLRNLNFLRFKKLYEGEIREEEADRSLGRIG